MAELAMRPEYIGAVQYLWYGHQNVPKTSDFEFSWKAIKAIASADRDLNPEEQRILLGKMLAILTPPEVVETVMRFDARAESPHELLARVDVPSEVRAGTGAWVVYEALSVSLSDGEPGPRELDAIRDTAMTMGVAPENVGALVELCREEAAMRQRRIALLHSTIATAFRFSNETEEQIQGRTRLAEHS
jgi:hypothetical protein